MSDVADSRREQRAGLGEDRVSLRLALADHRAEPDPSICAYDAVEIRDAAEVHQLGGRCQAEVEQRDEALASGDHLRLGIAGDHLHRLGEIARGGVPELGRLHGLAPSCAAIQSAMRGRTTGAMLWQQWSPFGSTCTSS